MVRVVCLSASFDGSWSTFDTEGFALAFVDFDDLGLVDFCAFGAASVGSGSVGLRAGVFALVDERVTRFLGSGASSGAAAFLRLGGILKIMELEV